MSSPPQIHEVIAALQAHEQELRGKGVVHAAVFGSVARGEAGPDSDVDIMVELNRDIVRTLFDYAGVYVVLERAVGRAVDLADASRLKEHVRPSAIAEAVRAF